MDPLGQNSQRLGLLQEKNAFCQGKSLIQWNKDKVDLADFGTNSLRKSCTLHASIIIYFICNRVIAFSNDDAQLYDNNNNFRCSYYSSRCKHNSSRFFVFTGLAVV